MLRTIREELPDLLILVGGQAFRHGGKDVINKYHNVILESNLDDVNRFLKNWIKMDRNIVLESAKRLAHTSSQTADEYHRKSNQLISLMNAEMLKRPDLESLVGQNNIDMMQDNHANHVRFIASILKYPNPEVLVETVLWVFRAYRSHGFTTNYWAAQLNTWIGVLNQVLTDKSYKEVYPYYEWMQTNIPIFVKISSENV